ncbi:hypothetical protein COY87_02185, partial [Candidatus Roizmanbacteria bacterium CG_4_10_14_0_8_um_filter_33_9]
HSNLLDITLALTVPVPTQNLIITLTSTNNRFDADVNKDGNTTYVDYYYIVLAKTGLTIPSYMNADLNNDGIVDNNDKAVIINILRK